MTFLSVFQNLILIKLTFLSFFLQLHSCKIMAFFCNFKTFPHKNYDFSVIISQLLSQKIDFSVIVSELHFHKISNLLQLHSHTIITFHCNLKTFYLKIMTFLTLIAQLPSCKIDFSLIFLTNIFL